MAEYVISGSGVDVPEREMTAEEIIVWLDSPAGREAYLMATKEAEAYLAESEKARHYTAGLMNLRMTL